MCSQSEHFRYSWTYGTSEEDAYWYQNWNVWLHTMCWFDKFTIVCSSRIHWKCLSIVLGDAAKISKLDQFRSSDANVIWSCSWCFSYPRIAHWNGEFSYILFEFWNNFFSEFLQRHIASHYKTYESLFDFTKNYSESLSYKEKLQQSLNNKLPMDLINFQDDDDQVDVQMQALNHFWTFVCNLVTPQESSPSDSVVSSSAPHVNATL